MTTTLTAPIERRSDGRFTISVAALTEGDHIQPNMYVGAIHTVPGSGWFTVDFVDGDGEPVCAIEGPKTTVITGFAGGYAHALGQSPATV